MHNILPSASVSIFRRGLHTRPQVMEDRKRENSQATLELRVWICLAGVVASILLVAEVIRYLGEYW